MSDDELSRDEGTFGRDTELSVGNPGLLHPESKNASDKSKKTFFKEIPPPLKRVCEKGEAVSPAPTFQFPV